MDTQPWCQTPIPKYPYFAPDWLDVNVRQRKIIEIAKENVTESPTKIPVRVILVSEVGGVVEAILRGAGSAVVVDADENDLPLEAITLADSEGTPVALSLFFLASSLSSEEDNYFVLYYDYSTPRINRPYLTQLWNPDGGYNKNMVAHYGAIRG